MDKPNLIEPITDIPPEVKAQIIKQQLENWKESQYDFEISLKVARRIGDPKERIDKLVKELERIEKALEYLQSGELEKE